MSVQGTNTQKQIFSLLKQLEGEINAQDLYVKLRERGEKLGLATGLIEELANNLGDKLCNS